MNKILSDTPIKIKYYKNKEEIEKSQIKIVVYQDRNIEDLRINEGLNTVFNSLKKKYSKNEVLFVNYDQFKLIKADYAVIWNVFCKFKPNTKYREEIKVFQKINNDNLIVLELGFINREKYYSISFDHISNFGNYPEFPNDKIRIQKLNLDLKNINYNSNSNKHILFCTQVPWDTQVQDIDYYNWVINSIKKLNEYTKEKLLLEIIQNIN